MLVDEGERARREEMRRVGSLRLPRLARAVGSALWTGVVMHVETAAVAAVRVVVLVARVVAQVAVKAAERRGVLPAVVANVPLAVLTRDSNGFLSKGARWVTGWSSTLHAEHTRPCGNASLRQSDERTGAAASR